MCERHESTEPLPTTLVVSQSAGKGRYLEWISRNLQDRPEAAQFVIYDHVVFYSGERPNQLPRTPLQRLPRRLTLAPLLRTGYCIDASDCLDGTHFHC